MTTEEFEKIGHFMGWRKGKGYASNHWVNADSQIVGFLPDKTSLTDSEAVEALNRLVEKGYLYTSAGCKVLGHSVDVRQYSDCGEFFCTSGYLPTIHEAVEQALLQIAARRGNGLSSLRM